MIVYVKVKQQQKKNSFEEKSNKPFKSKMEDQNLYIREYKKIYTLTLPHVTVSFFFNVKKIYKQNLVVRLYK